MFMILCYNKFQMSDLERSEVEKYVRGDIAKLRNNVISLVMGAAGIIAAAIVLKPLWFVSLGIGLGVFILFKLVLPGARVSRKKQKKMIENIPGISYEMYNEYLEEGYSKLKELKGYLKKIPYGKTKEKVKGITKKTQKILSNLEAEPKNIKAAKQFLNYYLDAFNKIMKRYVELSSYEHKTAETNDLLLKVEENLDSVDSTFQKQLSMLHDKKVLELDVELSVLKKMMETDGIKSDPDQKQKEKEVGD